MRPWIFAAPARGARSGARRLLLAGVLSTAAGVVLFAAARHLAPVALPLAYVVALVALGCLLHFGTLAIGAGLWRLGGVAVRPVCDAPWRSRSLSTFWSRRWNLPFSALMQLAVQRPLRARLGRGPATLAAFLFSGLLHEAALSFPARGGYGLPLAYFALHGALVLLEPRLGIARWSRGAQRAWTFLWLVVPAPLLFHPAFLEACLRPLLVP